MKKTLFLTIILFALLFTHNGWAAKPLPKSQAGPKSFFHKPEETYTLGNQRISRRTGFPVALYRLNVGAYSGSPEAMARQFLKEKANVLGMHETLDDIALDYVKESPAGFHVHFFQTYKGIPVFGSDLVVNINRKTRRVVMILSGYKPDIGRTDILPVLLPRLSPSEAIERARIHLNVTGHLYQEPKAELMIYRGENSYSLTYRTILVTTDPFGDWEVFIDAHTGDLLHTRNLLLYVDGSGLTFDPDPLTTANANYGDPGYADYGDADTTALNAERFLRPLKDLSFDGILYHLTGPYVEIE
ncbi:hypothetical protein IIA15_06170, partial [candidate division TA06 bacterium]|nr:hypothetical protein [candidate division TA06 bacterium]